MIVLFLLAVALTHPAGDFPLNDDWSFGATARALARQGTWVPTNFPSMPLITNALWAWPLCKLTACSFDDLRATTLLAALLLGCATFALLRPSASARMSALGAAAVLFNPIAYALSFTFMTDVLFWALFTASAAAFITALDRDSIPVLALATAVALAATLSRQLAPAVPLAYGVLRLLAGGAWPRRLAMAILPAALCALALAGFDHWLLATGKVSPDLTAQSQGVAQALGAPALLAKRVAENLTVDLLYTGLFSLPVLLALQPSRRAGPAGLPSRIAGLAAVLLCLVTMLAAHRIMPFGKNVLVPEGVGPMTLPDALLYGRSDAPRLPHALWFAVTALSLVGAYALVSRIVHAAARFLPAWRQGRLRHEGSALALLATLIYTVPTSIISSYDRYVLATLPLVFVVLLASAPRPLARWRGGFGAAVAACAALAVFAVAAEHDYLAWNRARWAAIDGLLASHAADAAAIDGGVEQSGPVVGPGTRPAAAGESLWFMRHTPYLVAFGPMPGAAVVDRYPYTAWLPPGHRSILLLKRDGAGAS